MWIQVRDLQKPEQSPPDKRFLFDAKVNGQGWRCLIGYGEMTGAVDKLYVAGSLARAALVRYCKDTFGEGFLVPSSVAGHYTWQQHNSCPTEVPHAQE